MEIQQFHKEIPTWDNGTWTETVFEDRNEFIEFVHSVFKEPGKYDFDDTSLLFNEQARLFKKNGFYCNAPFKTKDFLSYWDFEKKKNIEGVIFKNNDKVWYLPREYYFWINFLPIYDKIKKDFDFPLVWDVQLHMSLYECLAELHWKHAVITKKRQIASSYFHAAKLINRFWFDSGAVLKMGASLKKYVNLEGTWKYLEEYKNFLNTNTAWYRPLNPSKEGNWQQKIEVEQGGRKYTRGLKSTLLMTSFEKSETSSVGGPCHRIGTKIVMSDGILKNIEDIVLGEYVMGIDWKPKVVKRIYSGNSEMYSVKSDNSEEFYATGNHILYLKNIVDGSEEKIKVNEYNNYNNENLRQIRYNSVGSKDYKYSKILSIEKVGNEKYAGIEVEDNLYFLKDLTVTHNCTIFFHEEAGIAPKMDKTYIYLKSALEMGDMTTGLFVAAGSVGELKDCDPLKEFMLNPEANGFLGVETDLIDDKGNKGVRGLFIPEQWGMPPYIDGYGNSMIEDALKALDERFDKLKKDKDPSSYQLEISQHPRNLQEAFAYRDISIFPMNLIEDQKIRIEDNEFPYELIDLSEDVNGNIIVKRSNHSPIKEWPISKSLEDKQGAIQVWERPDKEILFNEYIASIDPVKTGKTTTSESLNSIYIYKNPIRVNRNTSMGKENYIEGDKVVACWCGRFDEPKKNHKRLELMLKWYNCKAIVEANVTDFINYMIEQNLAARYLVRKDEMVFLKEYNLNSMTYQDYGWKNTGGQMFKNVMLPMFINYLNEVLVEETNEEGDVVKKIYGIRRIPDIMAMKEMAGYTPDKNVDRLISLTALVCYLKAQQANHLTPVKYESDDNLEKNRNLYKLKISPFRNQTSVSSNGSKMISPFRKNRW